MIKRIIKNNDFAQGLLLGYITQFLINNKIKLREILFYSHGTIKDNLTITRPHTWSCIYTLKMALLCIGILMVNVVASVESVPGFAAQNSSSPFDRSIIL